MSDVRMLQPVVKMDAGDKLIWATIHKNKETKPNNRRLFRVAQALQKYLAPGTAAQDAWRCVRWKSGIIVLGTRRVARITMVEDRVFTLSFCDGWYGDKIFRRSATAIEECAHRTMSEQPAL